MNATTTSLARPFTQVDWYGFAGCECWTYQGHKVQPLLREIGDNLVIVADRNGFGATRVIQEEVDGYDVDIITHFFFPTQMNHFAAELFLNALPEDLDDGKLLDFGFLEC